MKMSTLCPILPDELVPDERPDMFFLTCAELWEAVLDELQNSEYTSRQHHNTGTHDRGCRGPLCKKAYREHPRRRTTESFSGYTPREERIYDPIMEYFHTIGKHRIKTYQLALYKELAG